MPAFFGFFGVYGGLKKVADFTAQKSKTNFEPCLNLGEILDCIYLSHLRMSVWPRILGQERRDDAADVTRADRRCA
jgi:hypothetical protein